MQPEIPAVEAAAAPAEPVDFYFTCSVLRCTLRASACLKNRKEVSRVDSLILTKQSTKCKGCKQHEAEQAKTAVSIEAYHAQVMGDAATQERGNFVRDSSQSKYAEWQGRGRNQTRNH